MSSIKVAGFTRMTLSRYSLMSKLPEIIEIEVYRRLMMLFRCAKVFIDIIYLLSFEIAPMPEIIYRRAIMHAAPAKCRHEMSTSFSRAFVFTSSS